MTATASLPYVSPGRPMRRPRLWPGVVLAILQWVLIKGPAWLAPGTMLQFLGMVWGPIIGTLTILIWWLFASRLPWKTRWTGLAAFIAGAVIAFGLGDRSMIMALVVIGLPVTTSVWVLWTLAGSRLGDLPLRIGAAAVLLISWGVFAMLRFNGLDGDINFSVAFRWSETAEARYVASRRGTAAIPAPDMSATARSLLAVVPGDWPAFRGPMRDGRLSGVSIRTDWAQHPPKQLWHHLIGPGWSSYCVVGDLAFTQEQRNEYEVVVCYRLGSGQELWSHQDQTRFTEAMAGAGPRATPTFHAGRLYAFGATGRLNCLNPLTGELVWSRDVAGESGAHLPNWGFSSSPLIVNDLVAVLTGAKGKSIMTYNAATGAPAWSGGDGWSYCSPQLSRLDGVDQILYVTESGATALEPLTGRLLWEHTFRLTGGANRVTQLAVIDDQDVLFGAYFGVGTRRIHITHAGPQWQTDEVWTSRSIKPYYNDLVIHKGYIYGFDGSAFTCIDIRTGKPAWRATKAYGSGQVLLLADQDLLLILSERGEVALVDAKPAAYHEIAGFKAIEGKTWNHPVIAHGKLLVRNGEETACYELQ